MSLTTVFVIGVLYYYRGNILAGIKIAVVGGIILLPVTYVLGLVILYPGPALLFGITAALIFLHYRQKRREAMQNAALTQEAAPVEVEETMHWHGENFLIASDRPVRGAVPAPRR